MAKPHLSKNTKLPASTFNVITRKDEPAICCLSHQFKVILEPEKSERELSQSIKLSPKQLSQSLKLDEIKQFSFQGQIFNQFDFKPGKPRAKQTLVFPKPKTPFSLSIYDIDARNKSKNRRSIENVVEPPKPKPESQPYDGRVRIFQDFSRLDELTNKNLFLKREIKKFGNYFSRPQPKTAGIINAYSSCPALPSISSITQSAFITPKSWKENTQPKFMRAKKRVKTFNPTSKKERKGKMTDLFM
ncbi:unnamed protein product [Blepharisma stoltei]|uniref:Uncharacterized protein n=1 Tax=Blepharisma stoltei TaxID=1481888 RepID=A0AAU9ILB2_9CILI|nr:unnamed protein product [Blepharisma stoltei]